MLDHIGFAVSDLERAREFYMAALAPLGISVHMEVPAEDTESGTPALGLGVPGKLFLWIAEGDPLEDGLHVAITAESRAQVDAFHRAALAAGGIDNGAPGIRAQYHPTYYGAFVLDPDGYNIEAVCHRPE